MMQQQQQQRPQECDVCLLVYEEQDRRPRNLPCGHSFCSLCVGALLQDGCLTCPSCRTDHLAPNVDHFPIAYALEAMVRALQAAMGGTPAVAEEASLPTARNSQARGVKGEQKAAAGLSRKLRSMIQEQQTSLGSMAVTLQQELDQLSQYRAQLALSRAEHGRLLEELDKLAQQHRAAIKLLQEEDVRVEAFMQEGQEVQREVRTSQDQLQQVSTPQQAFCTFNAADLTTEEVEEWLQNSKEKIPNSTALSTSYKEVEATKAALEAARALAGAMSHHYTPAPGHLHCTIMEAVDSFKGGPLQLEDLQREEPRKRLEAGQVFAVMRHEDGTCYSSKMKRTGNKTLLHSLKPGSPPLGASTLQVSRAVEGLDYGSISVFLDLSWLGTSSCHVHIRLLADTPLTRRFVTLCLGHTGFTFHRIEYQKDWYLAVWLQETSCQRAEKSHQLPSLQAHECGDSVAHPTRGMLVAEIARDLGTIQNPKFGIIIDFESVFSFQSLHHYYCLGCVEEAEVSAIEKVVNTTTSQHMQVVNCYVVVPL